MRSPFPITVALALLGSQSPGLAGEIAASPSEGTAAAFDILATSIRVEGATAVFAMTTAGNAGDTTPQPAGALAGAPVLSYVWPTTLDSGSVGFAADQGILAFGVTTHPDFDDTPWFDEDADGDPDNDGAAWHSHWVVLVPDDACGPDALKVQDIPEGTTPRLPATWPGLPLLIDSPGYSPIITENAVEVRVPAAIFEGVEDIRFDGVTAGLRVNADLHAPLLCVVDVFDIASGDLSRPGTID